MCPRTHALINIHNHILGQKRLCCLPECQQLLMIAIKACMPALCTLVSWETKQLLMMVSTTAVALTPAKGHTCTQAAKCLLLVQQECSVVGAPLGAVSVGLVH